MKRKISLIFLFILIFGYNSFALTENKLKVMIAQAEFGKNLSHLPLFKIEAGLNLALNLSEKYKLITFIEKDSCLKELKKEKENITVLDLAKALKADLMVFIKINSFVNMMRAEVVSVNVSEPEIKKRGLGYGLIRYYNEENDAVIYDPTILKTLQRAFAGSVRDSNMFIHCSGEYKVRPVPTLVIGGLQYIDDEAYPRWNLFWERVVSSYDALETMFEQAQLSPNYQCYDVETRDSIYSMFNLHIPENYNAPTKFEINALNKMEVEYYLTGEFKRIRTGAFIELRLCKIEGFQLEIIKTVNDFLEKDDKEEFRKILKKLVYKLLDD